MGYAKQAVKGFGWNSIFRLSTMVFTIAKISVLARLLTPEDFGLFSLVVIALGVTEAATQTGVNVTIISSHRSVKYFLSSAWVIAILRGFGIGIIMVILSLFMKNYYNEPQLPMLISLTALVPIIKGFINPSIVSLRKELQFFWDMVYRISLVVVEVSSAIILGLILKSVLALILALIIAAVFEVLISFIFFKDRPRFEYIPSRGKIILGNARGLTLSAALNYIHENVDDLIIGKVLGTYNLGLYHNAYALSHKVNYEPAKAIVHSTFPVYAKIADDTQRLKNGFMRSIKFSSVLVFLTSLPLLLAPEFFVNLLLGEQWLAATELTRWLVFAGMLQSISSVVYNLFLAKSAFAYLNSHQLASVLILIILLIVLPADYGLLGGAMAVVFSRLLTMPILFIGAARTLNK